MKTPPCHSVDPRDAVSFLLVLILVVAPSCSSGGDDGGDVVDPGSAGTVELHYDAANDSAPNLAAATYEAAARFPTSVIAAISNGKLVRVRFYVRSLPTSSKVKIYGAGTTTSPGAVLYSADVTADLSANSWNSHTLPSPIAIPNGDLWIAVEFTNPGTQATIGCDPGPAVSDGDWLYASTDGNWTPLSGRVAISINWNIRGVVELPE